ncbi:Ycf51 family protein [Prochlorococcus marinus]|nr:Ycf51 family protein [Prochlorococcus marinus]
MSEVIQNATKWLAWGGAGLGLLTILAYLFSWGIKFRLTGITIFTLLLSASCWAFEQSYTPPYNVEGYKYAPIVYDNGFDLVVAQATNDFPEEAIQPTLQQIAGNLKGGSRNGAQVKVRLRKIEPAGDGISKPIILGEVMNDLKKSEIIKLPDRNYSPKEKLSDITNNKDSYSLETYE